MSRTNRIFACLLTMTIFFIMLLSTLFIVTNAGHDCGEDCQICIQISVCENMQKLLSLAVAAAVLAAFLMFTFFIGVPLYCANKKLSTPIALKVKLLN